MMRRIATLGVLSIGLFCGSLAPSQPAQAQGLWVGGVGLGSLGPYGGFAPVGFGYPMVASPVVVARPVAVARPAVPAIVTPVCRARPAVQAPLNRAYRRAWRAGW